MIRLRFLVKVNPRRSELGADDRDMEVSFVPMDAVHEYGGLRLDETKPLSEVASGYTCFRDGDVLVAKITPCFENGKGTLAAELTNGVGFGSTELHVLRGCSGIVSQFLFYLTQAHPFHQIGAAYMYGAGGQKRVPEIFVKDFCYPIPPLSLQQAISTYLDRETVRIDALIEKKQRQTEVLQEERSAIISHAVTKGLNPDARMKESGNDCLGEIPDHWAVSQLRRAVRKFVDYRGRTPNKTESGIPLITAGAVRHGRIDHSLAPQYVSEADYQDLMVRGLPEFGDVVLTTEAPLGESALVEDSNVALAQRIMLLKVESGVIDARYLHYYYQSCAGQAELRSRGTGSTAIGIRSDHLKMSQVLLPPLREQRAIISFLDRRLARTSDVQSRIGVSIRTLYEYRAALVFEAVTGKFDVHAGLEA